MEGNSKLTSGEVIEAILDNVFTPEEFKELDREITDPYTGRVLKNLKECFLWVAEGFMPKYSIEKSIRLTNAFIAPRRSKLASPVVVCELFRFLFERLFKEIKVE